MLQFQSETKGLRTGRTSSMVPSNARKSETQEESVFQFESEGRKRPGFQLSNNARGTPLLNLFVLFRSSVEWMDPLTMQKAACFTESSDSNVNLRQDTLQHKSQQDPF